jgi:hypothetical protein
MSFLAITNGIPKLKYYTIDIMQRRDWLWRLNRMRLRKH